MRVIAALNGEPAREHWLLRPSRHQRQRARAQFFEITAAGCVESHLHDVPRSQ